MIFREGLVGSTIRAKVVVIGNNVSDGALKADAMRTGFGTQTTCQSFDRLLFIRLKTNAATLHGSFL